MAVAKKKPTAANQAKAEKAEKILRAAGAAEDTIQQIIAMILSGNPLATMLFNMILKLFKLDPKTVKL